jgi:hypothetical protein
MKNLKYFLSFQLIFILINLNIQAQVIIPCNAGYNGIYNYYPNSTNFCKLTTDMSLDVMIGYIAFDSLCTKILPGQYGTILNSKNAYNDTILYVMKYLYKLMDYNPMLFDDNLWGYNKKYYFTISPHLAYDAIFSVLRKVSDNRKLDIGLICSSYIFHVRVTNVVDGPIDSSTQRYWTFVQCKVLDTIKGKVYPNCTENNNSKMFSQSGNNEASCFQFQYSPFWSRGVLGDVILNGTSENPLVDSLGKHWVKPNEEYIVFLLDCFLCNDSSGYYTCTYPAGLQTMTYTMFPIKADGTVYDPGNDFGFGTPIDVNSFKQFLDKESIS